MVRDHPREVPEPLGNEWLTINDVRLLLPKSVRGKFDFSSMPSNLSLLKHGGKWEIVHSALSFLLRCIYGKSLKYQVDRVIKIGKGLNKNVYRGDITIFEGDQEKYESYAISQLCYDADLEASSRIIKEHIILDSVGKEKRCFSMPEPFGIIWHNGRLISAMSFVCGIPLKLRAGKSQVERPWEIVGKVAADIHTLPTDDLPKSLGRYLTRERHAIALLKGYQKYDIPEIRDTLHWIRENLPQKKKSVLIHGDLLGQNILWTLEKQPCVIDWEYAILGDPAFDLAIVTRGVSKPFQTSGGLHRLIDSYLSSGGQEITVNDVYVHELLLCLSWYEQAFERSSGDHSPEYYLDFLRRLLKRVGKPIVP